MSKVKEQDGRKDDDNKLRMDLLPFLSIDEVAKVLTFGARKYAPDNWQKVPCAKERYAAALLRHFSAWKQGETFDRESGDAKMRHMAQVAVNALFLIWFEIQEEQGNE